MRLPFRNLFKIGALALVVASPFLMAGKMAGKMPVAAARPAIADTAKTELKLSAENMLAAEAQLLTDSLELDEKGLNVKALEYALKGYHYLLSKGMLDKTILSICDFSQSSKQKRLYIIDVLNRKLILNTYVAHGKNSGGEYASSFSNKPESLKSSLGFYLTKQTYQGGHGLSLRIQGLEKGYNDKADFRNIVVHGSTYVGPDFLRYNASCGRSFGCPAIPSAETPMVIQAIKEGSCLFIYHPNNDYIKHSRIINSQA